MSGAKPLAGDLVGWYRLRTADYRPETLNRIEQGRNKPSVSTITKIDRALKSAEKGGPG